ncbi:MAG: hypothetical protein KGZ75_05355 [Syntrophomonadaceae bacterium]|nr:hypothetical protein [Syntrophomonadaceae bacterium]
MKKFKLVIPVLVMFSLLAVFLAQSLSTAFAAKAFAHITVEVNPKLTMTVDSNEKVVSVEPKNPEARQMLSDLTIAGKNIEEALKLIADRLDRSGYLGDDNQLFFIVQPAEGVKKEAVSGVSERVLVTLRTELESRKSKPAVEIVVLDKPVQQAADDTINNNVTPGAAKTNLNAAKVSINDPATWNRIIKEANQDLLAAGFTEAETLDILRKASLVNPVPREIYEIAAGFVDMKDAGIPYPVSKNIFAMGQGLDQNVFRKEISTLISDLIDMHEAGISIETGIKTLAMAIGADRSLKEVSTIVSGIIDLKESGVPEAELLSRGQRAIEADPTLRNFDDLLGIRDNSDDDRVGEDKDDDEKDDDDDDFPSINGDRDDDDR